MCSTLAPFGFLLPFACAAARDVAAHGAGRRALPAAIESSQLAVSLALGYSYRVTEVDDVLLNFAGVLLGYALFALVRGSVAAPVAAVGRRALARPGRAGDGATRRSGAAGRLALYLPGAARRSLTRRFLQPSQRPSYLSGSSAAAAVAAACSLVAIGRPQRSQA